jgi:large subunit ribosomal protein L18
MERKYLLRNKRRARKVMRIRKHVRGTAGCPRLSVHRSSKQIYVQAVDDINGVTLAASSSLDKGLQGALSGTKREIASKVGTSVGERLIEKGVTKAVFDRGWYRYHGRVKALADGAREAGLKF